MMTAKMMETLKNAGIAKEWHMGDMHRLYIDLAKADKLYIEHNDNLKNYRLNLNTREIRNGKLWVDLETGEIGTKGLSPEEIIVSQIMELVAFLTPAETAETVTEETTTEEPRAVELSEVIRNSDTWDMEALAELCELADMAAEWNAADGETFESVAYAAAEKLGVEII